MSRPVFLFIQDRKLIRFLLSNPRPPMPEPHDQGAVYRWCRDAIKIVCGQDLLPGYWPIIPGAEVR